jgi:hypothetical protein
MGLSSYLSNLVCGDGFPLLEGHETLSLMMRCGFAALIIKPIFADVARNVDALISLIWDKMFTFVKSAKKLNNRSI